MTKVLSKLEIQAENAAMQSQKITKLDTVESSLENLSVVVSRQGKSLNDTSAVLIDHGNQLMNLTKRFERLAQAPEDEEDEETGYFYFALKKMFFWFEQDWTKLILYNHFKRAHL